jgi:mannose-6-phosphate isomerase-like protein (cupin superfamily)
MKVFPLIIFILSALFGKAQVFASGSMNVDTAGSASLTDNIYSRAAFGDSLSSSFIILIKKEVKPHRHVTHSEHVLVLEGEGQMKTAEKIFTVKKGDLIFIPKNTVHSVKRTGKLPLKVLSLQSPMFDGKDRLMEPD